MIEANISEENLILRNYNQALKSQQSNFWIESMNQESKSLIDNRTWNIVNLPIGRKAITGNLVLISRKLMVQS